MCYNEGIIREGHVCRAVGLQRMVRVVGAPTPTDVKGKTEEILLTIVGEDIILPPKNRHPTQTVCQKCYNEWGAGLAWFEALVAVYGMGKLVNGGEIRIF